MKSNEIEPANPMWTFNLCCLNKMKEIFLAFLWS